MSRPQSNNRPALSKKILCESPLRRSTSVQEGQLVSLETATWGTVAHHKDLIFPIAFCNRKVVLDPISF